MPLPLLLARKASSLATRVKLAAQRRTGRFAGRRLLSSNEGNDWLAMRIATGRPLMVTRVGTTELSAWHAWRGVRAQSSPGWNRYASMVRGEPGQWPQHVIDNMSLYSGFFPRSGDALARFGAALEQWIAAADAAAVLQFTREEQNLLGGSHAQVMLPMALDAYDHQRPWTLALENRKVLVVHPFAATIESQYPKRELLFGGKMVLPRFELRTVQAVQTLGGRSEGFPDWFTALDSMCQRISAIDFDVALIGAGAYGMALAAHVKSMGRQAVHIGGSTQVLFGIKGRRWDTRPEVARYYNEHWVRPSAEETPPDAQAVEGACYW